MGGFRQRFDELCVYEIHLRTVKCILDGQAAEWNTAGLKSLQEFIEGAGVA